LSLLENPRWQTEHRMSVGFPVQSSLPLINSHCLLRKWSRQKTWSSLKRQTQTVVLQGDFQLIKLKDFCLVVYRSFKGHVRQFFVQDADGLENRLVRVSAVSKSGNPGPGPVPKTRAQIRIFFITSLLRH
jgi:hypothetical protein